MLNIVTKYVTLEEATDPKGSGLVKLATAYKSLVSNVESETKKSDEASESLLKVTKEEAAKNETVQYLVKEFQSQIRSLMYEVADCEPQTIYLLIDALQEVKQEAMTERDYFLGKLQRDSEPTSSKPDDFEEVREEAEALREAIGALFTLVKSGLPKPKVQKEGTPEEFHYMKLAGGDFIVREVKKDKKGTGEFLPDLPRLPRSENSAPVGRAAVAYKYQWTWNGEILPNHLLPSDIAHDYVSDRKTGFVITWGAIRKAIEDSGQKFVSTPGNKISLTFPTGTLVGEVPNK